MGQLQWTLWPAYTGRKPLTGQQETSFLRIATATVNDLVSLDRAVYEVTSLSRKLRCKYVSRRYVGASKPFPQWTLYTFNIIIIITTIIYIIIFRHLTIYIFRIYVALLHLFSFYAYSGLHW